MSKQKLGNTIEKDADEDVTLGHGKGNGEGRGNETQAQQDAIYKQITELQLKANALPAGSDEKEKLSDQIRTLQKKEAKSR